MRKRDLSYPDACPAQPGRILDTRPVGLPGRRLQLDDRDDKGVWFLSSLPSDIELSEDSRVSWVTLTRTGTWKHPRYGKFAITSQMLAEMVRNFDDGTYGQDIHIDVGHDPDAGNAGTIKQLKVTGNRLRALVEWTPWGVKQITEKGFKYFSVDFHDNWEDPETEVKHGPVLFGAALTMRPFVKRNDPVQLSEEFMPPDRRVFMHPELRRQLSEHVETEMNKFLKDLRAKLEARKLSEGVIKQMLDAAEQTMKALGEEEEALQGVVDKFDETGKALAESAGSGEMKLSIDLSGLETGGDGGDKGKGNGTGNGNGAKALTEEQVGAIVAKQLKDAQAEADKQQKKLKDDLESRQKLFAETIDEAEGLDDETKKELKDDVEDLITATMTDGQVKKLAEFQISQANKVAAAKKLSNLGYQDSRSGSPVITVDDADEIKKLSEEIRGNLKRSPQHSSGQLRLPDKIPPFCERVLSEFDRQHAGRLARERKILAEGDVDTSRTDLPVSFQREVIREALSDLRVLELVQTLTDFGASATTQIPYEERDDVNNIVNDGVVYEGKPIQRAGIEQKMDLAYILPMKIAMRLTNEVMHFTRASAINWDAWGRNVESNARVMRELLARRICNMLQRVADGYNAVPVAAEDIAASLDGSNSVVTLANFPMVRPFQQKDLRGNDVGSIEHGAVGDFNGTPVPQWDGTGTQAAGTYWRPYNLNLGQIQFVDEAGDPVMPTEATATFAYSYATNVGKFDLDFDSAETTLAKHMNGALVSIGRRKAIMRGERFVEPNFMLMSPTLNDEITNAENFIAQSRRDGTDTDAMGDLERVKAINAWSTNAPNVDLGDERVLIGVRGGLSYVVAKPFQVEGQPSEARDSNGNLTGQKEVYGEEYNALHVPLPIRNRMTSVLIYSGADRA